MSDQLDSMVRRANLVVRDDQLEPLFGDDLAPRLHRLMTAKKEGRMQDTTPAPERHGNDILSSQSPTEQRRTPTGGPPPVRRRWIPALTAAAVVAVFGIVALIFFMGDDSTPPASSSEEIMNQAIAVAEQFVDAYNAYDAERVRALLAEDVDINSPTFLDLEDLANVDKLEHVMQFNSIVGFQYSPYNCDLSFRPAEATANTFLWVLCDYEMDSRLQEIVGYPRIAGSFGVGVVGGVITRIDDQFPFAEWGPNVDEPFIDWLNAEHPGAFGSVYVATGGMRYPRLSQEAFDLLSGYLDEYEAFVAGG